MKGFWILCGLAVASCVKTPYNREAHATFDVATAPSYYAGLLMCEQWLAQEALLPKGKSAKQSQAQEVSIETAVEHCVRDRPDQTGMPTQALVDLLGPKPDRYAGEIRRQAEICHRQLQTIYANCRV